MNAEVLTAVALGIGLSAASGFRVFIPMLIASVAAYMNILPVQSNFEWLGSLSAIIAFGTAAVVEVVAYYIPFVDNLLDTVTTPLAIGAGSLLMTSVLPVDNDLMRYIMSFIIGGGTAATIQGGSALTRLASLKLTAGAGNPVVATGENTASVVTSVASLFIPVIVAILVVLAIVFIFYKFGKRLFGKKRKPNTA